MTNLDKIKLAWSFGWSATIKDKLRTNYNKSYKIVGTFEQYSKTHILYLYKDEVLTFDEGYINKSLEITGYLYAGELAGNEPIPEGQKFRVKSSGKIYDVSELRNALGMYRKSEIEPVFT